MEYKVIVPLTAASNAAAVGTLFFGNVNGSQPTNTILINNATALLSAEQSIYLTLKNQNGSTTVNIAAATSSLSFETTKASFVPALKVWHKAGATTTVLENPPDNWPIPSDDILFIPVTAQVAATGAAITALENQLKFYYKPAAAVSVSSTTTSVLSEASSTSTATAAGISTTASAPLAEISSGASTTPAFPTTNGGTIPTGGAVGGIIGGLVAGLIFGGLIALLCIRRKAKSGRHSVSSTEHELKPVAFLGGNSTRSRLSLAPAALVGWKKHIPQEQSEKDLANSLTSINDHIEMYVAEFYGSRQANVSAGQIASLSTMADAETMKYAKAAQRQEPILERVIAAFLISRISFKSDKNDSLLSADMSTIPKRLGLNLESRDIGPRAYTERSGFLAAVAEWRVLTAFLTTDVDPGAQRKLEDKINNAVKLLIAGLSGFEDEQRHDSQECEEQLRRIVFDLAMAGQALFRQPSTFIFDWSDHSRSAEPTMVTFPALLKVMDESGHRFDKPKTVLPAKVKPY